MAEAGRIPLTVIGGFLGAGKTTLVNRILGGLGGIRAAVLVNDFGSVHVDAALIAGHRGETIALANGCVCCSIGGDLTDALIRVLSRNPVPEWIVIEASGVSDPWRIAQVGLVDPALELDGVVVLVDASAVREHAADPRLRDTLLAQIAAADLIVLNKRDLARDAGGVRQWLAGIAPGTTVLDAEHAEVPLEALTSLAHERARLRGPAPHALFESAALRCDGRFSARRLRSLLARMPRGVLRAKGILRTDEMDPAVLQFAGKHGSLRPSPATASRSVGRIVVVGLRGEIPLETLRHELSGARVHCTLAPPTSACFPEEETHGSR